MKDVCIITTPLGAAKITGDEQGIDSIILLEENVSETEHVPENLFACVTQLKDYFKGIRKSFDLKLNPSGTDFQLGVWEQLQKIPYGKTISYLELAKSLGDEKSIRAAAAANGKNPIWIVIPCHRVIGSNGSLVGYAGGLQRKKALLEHEGALKQMSLF